MAEPNSGCAPDTLTSSVARPSRHCAATLRTTGPHAGLDIAGVSGISTAQEGTFMALGAGESGGRYSQSIYTLLYWKSALLLAHKLLFSEQTQFGGDC